MKISAEKYTLEVTESEMWDLAHALRHDLQRAVEEREKIDKIHNTLPGESWRHFRQSKGPEMHMFKTICMHLGRVDYYDDIMREIEKRFGI